MKQKHLFLRLLLLTSLKSFGGIHRHDVPVEKYLALAKQPQFLCVGSILNGINLGGVGSCILIDKKFVLTAAHCCMESITRRDTIVENGQTIYVDQPIDEQVTDVTSWIIRFGRKSYNVKGVTIFPGYLDSATIGDYDLALIELVEPVTEVMPAQLYNRSDELNQTLTGVGYGASGPANRPEEVSVWLEKVAGENKIDSLGGRLYKNQSTILVTDFDCPEKKADCNSIGSAFPLPMEYGSAGGDSGGGSFCKIKNDWYLVGVLAGGGGVDIEKLMRIGYYGDLSKWTRVSVFYDWIKDETQKSEKN